MNPKEKEEQKLENLQPIIYTLQLKKGLTDEEFRDLYALLVQYSKREEIQEVAQLLGLTLDEADPNNFLLSLQKIINHFSDQPDILVPSIPPNLAEIMAEYDKRLAERQTRQQARIKENFPTLEEQIRIIQKLIQEKQADPNLVKKPNLLRAISHEVTEAVIAEVPKLTPEQTFEEVLPPTKVEEIVTKIFTKEAERAGFKRPSQTSVKDIARAIEPVAKTIATIPHPTREIPKPSPVFPKVPLPEEVAAQLEAESEGVAFASFRPEIASSIKRIASTPRVKIIQHASPLLSPPWQAMAKGIFIEDIEASLVSLEEVGLSKEHPTYLKLETLGKRIKAEQKKRTVLADGTVIMEDRPIVKVLKRYFAPEKRKGQLQIFDEETKLYLPRLSPKPIKSRFQERLNRFALGIRLYQRARLGPGKVIIKPIITPFRLFFKKTTNRIIASFKKTRTGQAIVKKTTQAAAKLAVRWGAKTTAKAAVKEAVRRGVKGTISKILSWGAKKLGLAVTPEPTVSKVLLALSFVWDFIKLGWKGVKGFFKGIINFFGETLPLKVKGTLQRGLDVTENALVKAVFIFSLLLGGFTSLALPAGISLIGAAAVPLVGSLTLLGMQIDDNAFILPRGTGIEEYRSRYIEVVKTANYPGAPDSQIANSALPFEITYQITVTAKESDLTNVRVSDSASLVQEEGDTELSSQSWAIESLSQNETWTSPEYTLNLTSNFKDSILTNIVVVDAEVAGEEETNQASMTLTIGTPPIPANALLAIRIVNTLNACPGLAKVSYGVQVNASSWPIARQCLIDAGLDQAYILETFAVSVNRWDELQCVAFVVAASQGSLPPPGGGGDAEDYCSTSTSGYTLLTDWDSLRPGDYVVSANGKFGHIAVVTLKSGAVIRVAEAMGDTGTVQIRPIGQAVLENAYCGYLRKN